MSAVLLFHQGWTDIINSLGLIGYFSNKYEKLYLINRSDAEPLINFYVKQFRNVIPLYMSKETIDNFPYFINNIAYSRGVYKELVNSKKLYIGYYDGCRDDEYKGSFENRSVRAVNQTDEPDDWFVDAFYSSYNIDPINRISMFSIIRDLDIEKNKKDSIIKTNKPYILYHCIDVEEIKLNTQLDINTIDLINLSEISYIFFDCIKLLEDSIEIHIHDSVWGLICYLLDVKYALFKNKKIYIYPKRDYTRMFINPKLDNWIIIK